MRKPVSMNWHIMCAVLLVNQAAENLLKIVYSIANNFWSVDNELNTRAEAREVYYVISLWVLSVKL